MKTQPRPTFLLAAACAALLAFGALAAAAEPGAFARPVIDLGVVVSDVEKAAKFYTEAIGFDEAAGFGVPGDFCKQVGLTDGEPLKIRVFTLGDGAGATRLKIMSTATRSKPSDNHYIDSQRGYSYITIAVTDMNDALARLKKAGVKPLAQCPVALPKELGEGVYLTLVRDPDGNLVELVGPMR
jgi:catechol 2,3-dioxygenase-like lactoylglutathione lyase family enzyme